MDLEESTSYNYSYQLHTKHKTGIPSSLVNLTTLNCRGNPFVYIPNTLVHLDTIFYNDNQNVYIPDTLRAIPIVCSNDTTDVVCSF